MKIQNLPLGKTGLTVPPIGFGAWSWGDNFFWGYGKGYGEADIHAAFETCMRAGINFFDTAEVYGGGNSERLLGKFLRETNRPAIVATKFFPYPYRLTKGSLRRALRGSLNRLGLPKVDLYQIHQPIPPVPIPVWMEALAEAVRQGLILSAGVSNYNSDRTRAAFQALARFGIPLASNQISYSLLHREPERDGLLASCRELGVTVIAYSPLMQGLLTGRYTAENPPPGMRGFRFSKDYLSRIPPLLAVMREAGRNHGDKTLTQVALNWTMAKGTIPIPGVKNARQAEDALGALGWQLSSAEVAALDAASDRVGRK
jgi:aryl-alcohol dehydrogenase-like predicted oxidoreductase